MSVKSDKPKHHNLDVYCSSQIYLNFSLYQDVINRFESKGGYVQSLMWQSLPFVLEQIVLSDQIILHPDTGKHPELRNTLRWISESDPSARKEAEAFFQIKDINTQDAFFVSKYGLPYSGGADHEEDLRNVANRMSTIVSTKSSPQGRSMSTRVLRSIEREVQELNDSISRSLQVDALPFEFPLLFYYMVDKADVYDDLFNIAFDLREGKEARSYRKWCAELNQLLNDGYIVKAGRALGELKLHIDGLMGKVRTPKSWTVKVAFPPSVSITHDFQIGQKRRHLAFVREVLEETRLTGIAEKVVKLHADSFMIDVPFYIDLDTLSDDDVDRYNGHWEDFPKKRRIKNEQAQDEGPDDIPF